MRASLRTAILFVVAASGAYSGGVCTVGQRSHFASDARRNGAGERRAGNPEFPGTDQPVSVIPGIPTAGSGCARSGGGIWRADERHARQESLHERASTGRRLQVGQLELCERRPSSADSSDRRDRWESIATTIRCGRICGLRRIRRSRKRWRRTLAEKGLFEQPGAADGR